MLVVAKSAPRGRVFLVGAGPGDPDLLTVKALRILQNACIVAYDELVGPAIMDLIPAGAERIPVGRRKGTCPSAPSIHPAVLERALAGHDVVRLKGGDPMVFGRGGEEAAELTALAIPFEIVPGVSAALGAAASSGIPLTHRDASKAVTFATAQLRHDSTADPLADLPRSGTIVLYMGLSTLGETTARLIAAGRAPETPAAVVSRATLPDERVVTATLATIAAAVEHAALATPALVVIGDVVARRVISPAAPAHTAAPERAATPARGRIA
ncbi:MAG: uroporphyrinogen-III C-methyltransferase [Labilithrix sp.]|nr:uroporphyrinogen-III C-methyltransferase [Labilithrix sp.]MCW5814487.1 uroporphyrinogen-III C-methyltransferase [Labilithrix sp.]